MPLTVFEGLSPRSGLLCAVEVQIARSSRFILNYTYLLSLELGPGPTVTLWISKHPCKRLLLAPSVIASVNVCVCVCACERAFVRPTHAHVCVVRVSVCAHVRAGNAAGAVACVSITVIEKLLYAQKGRCLKMESLDTFCSLKQNN